ncbi:hypothetical protein K439DRAFT_1618594 [Ramaria rubella]|nr:hypothetical protein K439DRAFT_1618594 [Ramaria rubella]
MVVVVVMGVGALQTGIGMAAWMGIDVEAPQRAWVWGMCGWGWGGGDVDGDGVGAAWMVMVVGAPLMGMGVGTAWMGMAWGPRGWGWCRGSVDEDGHGGSVRMAEGTVQMGMGAGHYGCRGATGEGVHMHVCWQ